MSKGNLAVRRRLQREVGELALRNWRIVGAIVLLWVTLLVGVTTMLVKARGWNFDAGLLLGLFVAAAVWLWDHFLSWSGFRHRQMGLAAEIQTAELLKHLSDAWNVSNHVLINARYDIDHVVVGPVRVYAIETKWTSTRPDQEGWLSRVARGRADGLHRALGQHGVDVEVVPVLVLWGRESAKAVPDLTRSKHGVRVVAGIKWRTWLPKLQQEEQAGVTPRADVVAAIDNILLEGVDPPM